MHIALNIIINYNYAAIIRGRLRIPLNFGDYSRAATIRSAAFIRGNTVYVYIIIDKRSVNGIVQEIALSIKI